MTPDLSTAPNAILRGSHQIDAEQWLQTFADEGASDKMRPELNIVDHLAAHGVTAQTVNLAKAGGGVGTVIVQYCRDNDPDLLVMGAYGRGKFVDMLFGGTTRYVLENMPAPVLMSH